MTYPVVWKEDNTENIRWVFKKLIEINDLFFRWIKIFKLLKIIMIV